MILRIKKNKLFFWVLLILFFAFLIFTLPNFTGQNWGGYAQALEVTYPQIPGAPLPANPTLPEYIRYIYNFSIIISGLIAFLSLVYGGFRYITSVGSPVAMADAREQIAAGIIGLIILLSSYLILTIVNPQLAIFTISKPTPPPIQRVCGNHACEPEGGETPDSCPQDCAKKPATLTATFLEVPVGTLIERLLETGRLNRIKGLSGDAEWYSKKVRDTAQALTTEINNCNCGKAKPNPSMCNADETCPTPPPVCMGDPCDRNKINHLRKDLKDAYQDFEIWLGGGKLYREMAKFRADFNRLYIAKVLLDKGLMPINYDNFLEIKQTLIESGQKVEVNSLKINGEAMKGKQDSANFYFDLGMNETLINDILFQLGAEIGMWDIIGDDDWTPFPVPPGEQILIWPTTGCISQWYDSYNPELYSGGCHRAIDIDVLGNRGTPVVAAREGTIYKVVNNCTEGDWGCGGGFGNYVAIEHQYGGITFYTTYAHLQSIQVSVGQSVNQGDIIGGADSTGMSTGDHLDFRLMTGDAPTGATYDPLSYLPPPPPPNDCPACGDQCHRPDLCTAPVPPFACSFGIDHCSVENLSIFGQHAGEASMICQKESGSNPWSLNDNCLSGISADYSVGLFQMNLLDRCNSGIRWTGDFDNPLCWIVDQPSLNQCKDDYGYGIPNNNIQKAHDLYLSNGGWCPPGGWSAAAVCGLCH